MNNPSREIIEGRWPSAFGKAGPDMPFPSAQQQSMDPQMIQLLMALVGGNNQLETLKFLHSSGQLGVPQSPNNYGGPNNPDLRGLSSGENPFFRSEEDRQANIASRQASMAADQNFGQAATTSMIQSLQQFDPKSNTLTQFDPRSDFRRQALGKPAFELGSPENPIVMPDGRRLVRLPNGSWGSGGGSGGLQFEQAQAERGGSGIYQDPRSIENVFEQVAAMDAQDSRQAQIQQELESLLLSGQGRSAIPQGMVKQRLGLPEIPENMASKEAEEYFGNIPNDPRDKENRWTGPIARNQAPGNNQPATPANYAASQKEAKSPDRIRQEIQTLSDQKSLLAQLDPNAAQLIDSEIMKLQVELAAAMAGEGISQGWQTAKQEGTNFVTNLFSDLTGFRPQQPAAPTGMQMTPDLQARAQTQNQRMIGDLVNQSLLSTHANPDTADQFGLQYWELDPAYAALLTPEQLEWLNWLTRLETIVPE